MRIAIRDALYRTSRKPFQWGGLQGYQQLQVIAESLQELCNADPDNRYWRQLSCQVERTVEKNRAIATQLAEAHQWLLRIAACLRYPPQDGPDQVVSGQQVTQEMEQLLPCYDIPGLPPDNLQLEAFFNRLRRHQRRITGRKSTRELNRLGHYQALFSVESEAELLEHLRQVPFETYLDQRQKVNQAEEPHRFLHGLHRDPGNTLKKLVTNWITQELASYRNPCEVERKDLCSV
jgi:hypothetical protein